MHVEVVLRKVGRKPGRAVVGRLLRPPRKGSVVVIEFPDGLHEYVTTPVKRVLKLCDTSPACAFASPTSSYTACVAICAAR